MQCNCHLCVEIRQLRAFKAAVTDVVERMSHQAPDGLQADYDLWEELDALVLR